MKAKKTYTPPEMEIFQFVTEEAIALSSPMPTLPGKPGVILPDDEW